MNNDNGDKNLEEASGILFYLIEQNNFKIFVANDSPWMDKARKIASNTKEPTHRLMHLFFSSVIRDSNKCKIIAESVLPEIPKEVLERIPQEDTYLVKLSLKAAPCVLVSTDVELVNSVKIFEQKMKITPILRDDWISQII